MMIFRKDVSVTRGEKIVHIATLSILAALIVVFACALAHADDPRKPAPTELSKLDRLELQNTMFKLRDLETQARALIVIRDRIYTANGIDPAQVGKTIGVDLETGKITRASAPPKK